MASIQFVCRELEIEEVISAIKKYRLAILHSQNNSGLTCFLMKVMQLLWEDNFACFYVDGSSKQKATEQIIGEVVQSSKDESPDQNKIAKLLKKYDKGDLAFSIITSCLHGLDIIPFFPNIGTIANSLVTSIKETIDTDQEHLADYKTEKAVAHFFERISVKHEKEICILVDNPHQLHPDEYHFLSKTIERFHVRVLFALNNGCITEDSELFSKLFGLQDPTTTQIYAVHTPFRRPDDKLISALFECYGKELLPEMIEIFERYERNIHVIMAHVLGIPLSLSEISPQMQYLLKVLAVLREIVPERLLFRILRAENLQSRDYTDTVLKALCEQAASCGFVCVNCYAGDEDRTYILNGQFVYREELRITYIEKQKIAVDAINAMDSMIGELNVPMLEFAITHLEHDYSHSKRYIIALAQLESRKNRLSLNHLEKLNYFENSDELFYVIGLFYDCGIYDRPYYLLQTHKAFSRKENYKIAQALICERLHKDDYVSKLEKLFDTITNSEKKCLIAAVLFVAYLNSDDSRKYCCFFDEDSKYYYQQFRLCNNYYYLLRNVSYYISDCSIAIQNYENCLNAFETKDPVNYNRTISNYICYLMRNDSNCKAVARLESVARQVRMILDYNDSAYSYLNNNYGIYLMRYTNENPSPYFITIPYSTGTTETPYIYAQVNLALYYLKTDPMMALATLDNIANQVKKTTVPRTKQFYNINRALVEFANGIYPQGLLEEIQRHPLRGNATSAQNLCNQYLAHKNDGCYISNQLIKELSLPGYLFYRYFKAEKLLSNF